MEWSIATQTGWSLHYIRWMISFSTIQMMLADAPRLRKKTAKKKLVNDDDLMFLIGGTVNTKKK